MAPKKKKPQLVAQLALPEAPRFTPTAQEWQDPLRYIAEVVRPAVEHTSGICRIVPPPEWVAGVAEEFAIDRASLKFTARVQRVDQLQRKHTAVASQRFWNEYNAWMAANGIKRKGKGGKVNPVFNGQEVELDRLHAVVTRRGGYTAVTEDRAWRELANVLDLEDKSGNAAFSLRKLYEKLLLPFDDHSHKRAAGAFGLLDAAMDAAETETKAAVPAEDDEAAEILSAMLGLAPPASKKRRKSSAKAGKDAAEAPAAPKEKPTVCAKCSGGHMPDKLVPCDRCNKGWHRFCLAPSVEVPAEGDWICPDCRTEEFEAFAFQDTDDYSLEEFQQVAATFEEQWFGAEAAAKLTDKEREAEFWRIVEDGEDVVEVLYGADLDSKEVGSGFPRGPPLGTSTSRFASDPWNLSVLPRQDGYHSSLLRVLDGNIAGVTVPWVYVGMCFSSFCWHVEDHMLYSVNYNHYGAAKQWYGVPAWAASRFEAVFRAELADQIESQPDLLFQLLSMLSPRALQKAGVPVYSATQAAGEFVVTFPNAYHAGLCLGVNLGEAVNFAAPDWLRFGAAALARLRHFRQPCVVSQEELLLRVAVQQAGPAVTAALAHVPGEAGDAAAAAGQPAEGAVVASSPLVCYHLGRELERVVEEQWVLRAKLWSEGLRRSRRTELRVGFQEGEQDDSECAICHIYMHLSAVECDCCQGRRVCLHHAHNLCGCHMNQRRLVYRHSLRQLESVRAAVQACVPAAAASEIGAAEEASAARIAAAAAAGAASAAVPAAGSAESDAAPQPAGKQKQQSKEQAAKAPAAAAKADDQAAAAVSKGSKSAGAAVRGAPAQQCVGVPAAGTAGGEQAPAAGSAAQQAQTETKPARMHGDGLVRPYASVDICPWDRAELPDWREALQRACEQWRQDAAAAMEQGREKGEVVEELAEECEQYLWGDMSPEAAELAARLQVAAAYMAHINAALMGKHGLEEVEAILAEDPKPVTDPPGLPKLVEGLAAAREWLQRAAPYFGEARVVELKALEGIASESNRLMVALPEAKQLRERAAAARKLADTMRSALPARDTGRRRTEQLGLTELRALRGQAAELRVDMPELNSLAMALERVDVWQSRVRVLTEMQAPIGELEEMVEEAEALPAAMPELQGLKAVLEKAGIWKAQMETLLSNRATLKRMRECLTAGTRLAVKLPEVEGLRLEIRRREWEESARRSLGPHRQLTLSALAEHVATAKDVGASNTQLAQGLRAKLEVAEAWEARAAELLERQSAGCAEEDRPVVSEVHELQAEGLDTGIRMDRLTQLTAQLMASMGWMERARALLTKAAGSGQQVTGGASGEDGSEGMDIDEQQGEQEAAGESAAPSAVGSQQATPEPESWATAAFRRSGKAGDDSGEQQQRQQQQRQTSSTPSTGLAGLPPLPAMPKQPRGVRVPKPMKSQQGSDSSGKPELSVINKLLDEYRSLLVRADEEAEGLRKLRGMADGWLSQARSVLEQDAVTDDQLGLLGELIASGEELGLAIEQVDILKANVEALLWARKVRAFLAQLPDPPCDQARPHLAEQQQKEQQQQQQQQLKKEEGVEQQAAPEVPQQQPVDAEAKQSAEVAATAAQQQLSGAAGEAGERRQAVQPAAEPVVEVLPFDKRPLLSEATALLQEGHILPCDDNLYNRLQSVVKQAQDFESQATHVLTRGRDITTYAHAIEASELERLLLDTERLGLKLENLPVLQQLLAGYRGWEAELEACIKDASGAPVDPSFEQLASASHAARAWPITSPLRSLADDTFHKTGAWTERLRRALVKRSSGARVDSCMAYLQDSVDAAVQQFERRLDAEKRVVATGGSPASLRPPVPDVVDKQELYCLCQRPFGKDTCVQTMVCCKSCSEWYHMRCVGLPHNLARATRNYTCPICAAVDDNTVPLEQATAKLQKTRRPDREQLAALLPELDAMPVQPASGVLLRKLITRFDRWGSATNRAVEVHEISRTLEAAADGAPSVLPLSQVMLHALLKSSMALEIDATEYADKVLRLLRCNKWREAVDAALMPPAKMTVEAGQKTLAASKQLGINLDIDITGTKLRAAIAKATKWAEQVEACIRELKKEAKRGKSPSFDEAVGRADVLAKESEQLGLKVDAQLERLQEACKLYCLCKQPYNEDRPMVGCDFCQDWYHHECVGLKVPGSQGDGDEPPDTFRCPLCCMKVAATFEHYHKMPASSLNALKEAALKLPPPPKPAPPAAAAAPAAASPAAAPARASVPAQPAAPGRPVMPAAGFSPAAWQAARQAAIAANMSAAGMQPGGLPAAGLPPDQVAAALGNMSRIFQAGGFQAAPGMMPGVYSMTPQLMAAFQKQQIEALARAKHAATPSGSAGPQKAQALQVAAGPGSAPRPQQQQQQQQQARSVVQQQQQQKVQPLAQLSTLAQGAQHAQQAQQPNGDAQLGSKAAAKESQAGPSDAAAKPVAKRNAVGETQQQVAGAAGASSEPQQQEKKQKVGKQPAAASKAQQETKQEAANKPPMAAARVVAGESPQLPATTAPDVLAEQATAANDEAGTAGSRPTSKPHGRRRTGRHPPPMSEDVKGKQASEHEANGKSEAAVPGADPGKRRQQASSPGTAAAPPPDAAALEPPSSGSGGKPAKRSKSEAKQGQLAGQQQPSVTHRRSGRHSQPPEPGPGPTAAVAAASAPDAAA